MNSPENNRKNPIIGIIMLSSLFFYLVCYLIINYISAAFSDYAHIHIVKIIIKGISTVIIFIVPCFLYYKINPYCKFNLRKFLGINRLKKTQKQLESYPRINFIFASAILLTAINIVGFIGDFVSKLARIPLLPVSIPDSTAAIILSFISVVIITPICEEALYRGVVLNEFPKQNEVRAVIMSGLLFGIMHYNASQFFYAFAAGLIIGYFVIKTGSLIFGIALHMLNNALSYTMIILGAYLSQSTIDSVKYAILVLILIIDCIAVIAFIHSKDRKKYLLKNSDFNASYMSKELSSYILLGTILSIMNMPIFVLLSKN